MTFRRSRFATILAAMVLAIAPSLRAQSVAPVGCYRFDRPLGGSAVASVERADSAAYTLQLLAGGKVARPAIPSAYWRSEYARSSRWRMTGDTLHIRLSTSLVGWDIVLTPSGDSLVGSARYLSDATGGPPFTAPVSARHVACQPGAANARGGQRAATSGSSGACSAQLASIAENTAQNMVADRAARNVYHLPWSDTLPLQTITDSVTCARSAKAYTGRPLPSGVAPLAGVVRAGGLYFVVATPIQRAGEFMLVAVLDSRFRVIEYVTT